MGGHRHTCRHWQLHRNLTPVPESYLHRCVCYNVSSDIYSGQCSGNSKPRSKTALLFATVYRPTRNDAFSAAISSSSTLS